MKYPIALILLLFLSDCKNIPADPEDSYSKAQATGLSVGFSSNPPWVIVSGDSVYGIEPELIRRFAENNQMKIVWKNGPEQKMLKELEEKKLHIFISGLTGDTPWKKRKVGLTRPFFKGEKEKHVMAIMQGENRLLYHLEKYLFNNKDSINALVYREYDRFNKTGRLNPIPALSLQQ
jgi:polar amino acid transport system substrate-binding protein